MSPEGTRIWMQERQGQKSLEWPRKVRGMGIPKPLFIITVNTEILSCALDQQLPDGSSLSILRLLLEMKTDSPRLFS